LAFLYQHRDKYFGNARVVRQVVLEIIKNQNLRVSAAQGEVDAHEIQLNDVATFTFEKDKLVVYQRRGIGF
jgi:hypothetical protein